MGLEFHLTAFQSSWILTGPYFLSCFLKHGHPILDDKPEIWVELG